MNANVISQGTLTPAYGKDYKSKLTAIEAFRGGQDFIYNNVGSRWSGKYCSIRDCHEGEMIKLRYNGLRHAVFYTVTGADLV